MPPRTTVFENGSVKLEHQDAYQGNFAAYILTIQTPLGPSETVIPDGSQIPPHV